MSRIEDIGTFNAIREAGFPKLIPSTPPGLRSGYLAIDRSIEQVARHFVKGNRLEEGMLNRVSAVVRAYDPCLSCSTHAGGLVPLRIELLDRDGALLDE